jgi:putative thioredoxin
VASLGMTEQEKTAVEKFDREVVQPSMNGLIVLQFTATWCGPCKQLSPILDKVAGEYAAKGVKLVRIDVDEDKLIAAQFRIQSVPTVYALFQGQPVADLTPYRTEGQLRQVLDKLIAQLPIKGEAQSLDAQIGPLIAMGEEVLASGDAARAVSIFRQILEMAPEDDDVIAGLVRALVASGEVEEARSLLDKLPESAVNAPGIARARAAVHVAGAAPSEGTAELEARLAANPGDHEARFAYAGAKMAAGDREAAADALIELIQRDRAWNDGAARNRLLQLLESEGLEDPWARAQRRRLSAVLFS